jgi:hypothetical protein
MTRNRNRGFVRYAAVAAPLTLSSCERAPAFDIVGSFFPAWLFCLVVGILLTVVARFLLLRVGLEGALTPPVLMYPSLTALFTFAIWLIFFRQ